MSGEAVTRWGWTRPGGVVYAVEVRPTCDGRGWYEARCQEGCCGSRYTRAELYGSEADATTAARAWVMARVRMYTAALDGLEASR